MTVTDHGGPVLTNVEVVAIFWGSYWTSTSPPPAVSADTYYQYFTGIVIGPYMTKLRQYRGVGPGTMLGEFINAASDPPNPFAVGDVETMLTTYLQNNSSCPPPLAGHNRFYAIVTPPKVGGPAGDEGEHLNFTYDGVQAFYAFITDDGQGLTQGSDEYGIVQMIAGSYLINNTFVYNPATQGAVVSLSASVNKMIDLEEGELSSLGVTFLIEQTGNFYAYGLSLPTEAGTWLSANTSNLVASDFDLITNLAELTENAADHPSFSSGGPLMFGFRSGFTDGGGGALTANTYIADLSYNINAVPLPSTRWG